MFYQAVNGILQQYNLSVAAAEAHGMAVGLLLSSANGGYGEWMNEIFGEAENAARENAPFFSEWFERIDEVLHDHADDFAFEPLLPDDEEPLVEQAEAVRCWSLGLLFGIGSARPSVGWPEDIEEIMKDIVEFTKIDTNAAGEEDVEALMEIREYLRIAVFILRDYFREMPPDTGLNNG